MFSHIGLHLAIALEKSEVSRNSFSDSSFSLHYGFLYLARETSLSICQGCWKGQAQPKYKVGCGEACIRDGWDDAQGRKVGIVCIEVKPYLTIKPERCKTPRRRI